MPKHDRARLLSDVSRYYSDKIAKHGPVPSGVDWNGEEGQLLRFEQLSKILPEHDSFSINDFGCGYGALCEYLRKRYPKFNYLGVDLSEKMIAAAAQCHDDPSLQFKVAPEPDRVADFGVASGIFNVCLSHSKVEWLDYVKSTLDILDRTSCLGFSFNCLTSYSDEERKRSDLFYGNPCELFDHCKRYYSRNVALLHDYGLYEFTILVRKES